MLGIYSQIFCKELKFMSHFKHKTQIFLFIGYIEKCFCDLIIKNIVQDFHFHRRSLSSSCSRSFVCSGRMMERHIRYLAREAVSSCKTLSAEKYIWYLLISCLTFCLRKFAYIEMPLPMWEKKIMCWSQN